MVDMGDTQVVVLPDFVGEPLKSVADTTLVARWTFSFSVSEAAFLAGLQADFLRPL